MKKNPMSQMQIQDLNILMRSPGGDDAEDGGGTDANPDMPDYADPDSQA